MGTDRGVIAESSFTPMAELLLRENFYLGPVVQLVDPVKQLVSMVEQLVSIVEQLVSTKEEPNIAGPTKKYSLMI